LPRCGSGIRVLAVGLSSPIVGPSIEVVGEHVGHPLSDLLLLICAAPVVARAGVVDAMAEFVRDRVRGTVRHGGH
jgi:hypothetical protein